MSGNTLKKASPRRLYQLGKIFMFLLAIGLTTTSFAQQSATDLKTVKGTVVDETNQPIPGATILVQNSTRGVVTDELGKFEITVLPSDKLVISFIGLETKTIPIGDKTTLSIVLLPKANELDGVTVVAFAKQKKESVVGAITTVTPKDLKVPSSNLTTALAGRVAGMISYQTSGEPGADNAQFFIRGIGTFGSSAKKDPLILIDNLEVSATDLARLQPDDIASFSIMKDATAAALYGSRGANGVILPPKGYMEGVRKLCDEKGILLILDEIQCGMGRTGSMFAYQQYGVKPDIVTVAKALGCGVPVGAFLATDEVAKALVPGDHGTTYGGNPLACAAAVKVFELFDSLKVLDNVKEVGAYLASELDKIVAEYDIATERRGMGLIQGLQLVVNPKDVIANTLDNGLILFSAGTNVIRFVPPLVITKADVDEMIVRLKKSLDSCR